LPISCLEEEGESEDKEISRSLTCKVDQDGDEGDAEKDQGHTDALPGASVRDPAVLLKCEPGGGVVVPWEGARGGEPTVPTDLPRVGRTAGKDREDHWGRRHPTHHPIVPQRASSD